MTLIVISLITGYIGMSIGSAYNLEGPLGIVGFLSPALFLLHKIYVRINEVEEESD